MRWRQGQAAQVSAPPPPTHTHTWSSGKPVGEAKAGMRELMGIPAGRKERGYGVRCTSVVTNGAKCCTAPMGHDRVCATVEAQ